MIAHVIALFEALTTSDLEAARPTDLERFAALCRHWASLADLSREASLGATSGQNEREPLVVASSGPRHLPRKRSRRSICVGGTCWPEAEG